MTHFDLHSVWGYAAVSTIRLRSKPKTGGPRKLAAVTELFRRVEPKPRDQPGWHLGKVPETQADRVRMLHTHWNQSGRVRSLFRSPLDSVRASTQQEVAECVASVNRTMKVTQDQDGERLFDDVQCLCLPPGGICQTSSPVWIGSSLLPRWQESRNGFVGSFRIWTTWKTGQFWLRLGMSWKDSDWRSKSVGEQVKRRPRNPTTGSAVEGLTVLQARRGNRDSVYAREGGTWSPVHNSR